MKISYGFDRSAIEAEPTTQQTDESGLYVPDKTKSFDVSTYSQTNKEENDGPRGIPFPFNRGSVERAPSKVFTYSGNYYGAAAKIGRNLETKYYGRRREILNL